MLRHAVLTLAALTLALGCSDSSTTGPSDASTGSPDVYTGPPPDSIACAKDSDCCVVTDACRSAAYVVHAGDTVKMPPPAAGCNACIVPAVQVWCENGLCKSGQIDNVYDGTDAFRQDHCGSLPVPDGGVVSDHDGGVIDGGWGQTLSGWGCDPFGS